jgi:hypothetical protein
MFYTRNKDLLLGKTSYIGKYTGNLDNTASYRLQYYTNYFDFGAPTALKILKKISMILIVQSYKSVPRAMRINSSDMVFFYIGNDNERDVIASEMPTDQKLFLHILDDATAEPFSFLVVHNKKGIEQRFQKRFTGDFYRIKKTPNRIPDHAE